MDKPKVMKIRKVLDKLFSESAELKELGVTASLGNCRFGKDSASFAKFTFIDNNSEGETVSQYALDYKNYCWQFKMEESDFGKTFKINGVEYKIAGLSPGSSKFPVLAEKIENGRIYKFPVETVKTALGK